MLICVTKGRFTHTVDFTPISCGPASVVTLRPAQIQRFDTAAKWDAWIMLFKPEFLLPLQTAAPVDSIDALGNLDMLPPHFSLNEAERHSVHEAIAQMHRDAKMNASSLGLHALLQHQLYALLLRLHMIHGQREITNNASPKRLLRFKRFQ
jgi:hypothetical protein